MGPDAEKKLRVLEQGGLVEKTPDGLWRLVETGDNSQYRDLGACVVLPTGAAENLTFAEKLGETLGDPLVHEARVDGAE